jgi:anti-sigma factor RsiW
MDHKVAITTHAVERYLLGEMPVSERDAFEEHYFECAECGNEVRSGSDLMRDMKAALRDSPAPKASSPGWFSWLKPPVLVPTFAAFALLAVVGYQNLAVLPDLEAPRSMGSPTILDGRTRGDAPSLRAGEPLRFLTAVEGAAASRLYVELTDASGSAVRHGEVAAPGGDRPLDVFFPGKLAEGRYQLVVREGKGGREIARSAFDVTH